ncbi:hypothetical protein THAOC_24613, partial [Thalassiosira oceanica]
PGYCPPPEPLPIQQQFGDLPPYPVRPQERFQSSHRQPPAPAGGLVQHSTNPTSASARPVLKDCTNQPTPRESPRKPEPADAGATGRRRRRRNNVGTKADANATPSAEYPRPATA